MYLPQVFLGTAMGGGLQPVQSKAPFGVPGFTWLIPSPCCPPSPLKTPLQFFPKVTVQNQHRSLWKTKFQNYYQPLLLNSASLKTPTLSIDPPIPFHKLLVSSQVFVQVLSEFLSNLNLTTACADVINLIFQMRNLYSWAYIIHPKSLSYSVAESNVNPGILTLTSVFFVPHSSCFQATKTHSLLLLQIHKQPKSTLPQRSSTHSLWPMELRQVKGKLGALWFSQWT